MDVHSNRSITIGKEERQHQIIQLIEQSDGQHMLGTRELAEQFGVSEMTVRRDLRELSQSGLLQRQHGGATPMLHPPRSQPSPIKEVGILLVSRTGRYTDPFFNAMLEGVDRKLQELGYRIAHINTRAEVSTAEQARDLLESHPVSGMIMVGPPLGAESVEYLKANMQALIQTIDTIGPDVDTVICDSYYGIRQMIDHLVQQGRQRLSFITGHYDPRLQAFKDGTQAHGLPTDDDLCVVVPFGIDGWTPEMGHTGAQHLLELAEPPDAIMCASDRIAIGVIQWLHQHNINVPNDIAVTGFDNIDESAFTVPSLTTIHVHKQLMGELAAERAVKRIENEDMVPLLIQTPTHLVIRQSCGSQLHIG